MYDVVVIGAGPAGSYCAYTCAKAGLSVVLLEEHPEIGIPVICGEGISREWVSKFVNIKPEWISSTLNGAIFYSPSGRNFFVRYENVGYILKREIFDKDLALMAEKYGAKIMTNIKAIGITKNSVITTKGEIKTKIIVGADGKKSRTPKWVGIDSSLKLKDLWVSYGYFLSDVDIVPDMAEFHTGREFAPGGYIWVFPKGKNLANVGVGISPSITKKGPKFFIDKFIEKRFKKYNIVRAYRGMIGSKLLPQLVKNNVLLVGDAARLVDPISGGGIGNAIFSGKLAAEACISAIKNNELTELKTYEKEWNKSEGKNFKLKIKIRDIALKLTDEQLEILYDFGNKNFGGKTLTTIVNEFDIIKNIIKFSPKLLKLGLPLIKSLG